MGSSSHVATPRFDLDGFVSTLATILATAFATKTPHTAFLVGLATAIGARISMAFSEGLSDDGSLTGRGNPLTRVSITGLVATSGGLGRTLSFLLPTLQSALIVAYVVVGIELITIAFIRNRYFNMSFPLSVVQVVIDGSLVFASGVFMGTR